jgi:hypothetical protein
LSKLGGVADQGYCECVYILKVSAQIGRVFDGLSDYVTDLFEAGVACLCTIFDEWNASFVAMVWVMIMNMMWAACMRSTVCVLRLRIEQDLRESKCRGHESRGGEKTLETWLDRGSVEVVKVFIGWLHPHSFGYSGLPILGRIVNLNATYAKYMHI